MNESAQANLARKYAALLRLRTVTLTDAHMRTEMQTLAREFPGALRELDELPLGLIEERLERLTNNKAEDAWVRATLLYHQALAASLAQKALQATRTGSIVKAAIASVADAMGLSLQEADALVFAGLRRRT